MFLSLSLCFKLLRDRPFINGCQFKLLYCACKSVSLNLLTVKFRLSLLVKDTSNSNDQLGNKVCQAYFDTYEKLYNWQPFMTRVYFSCSMLLYAALTFPRISLLEVLTLLIQTEPFFSQSRARLNPNVKNNVCFDWLDVILHVLSLLLSFLKLINNSCKNKENHNREGGFDTRP